MNYCYLQQVLALVGYMLFSTSQSFSTIAIVEVYSPLVLLFVTSTCYARASALWSASSLKPKNTVTSPSKAKKEKENTLESDDSNVDSSSESSSCEGDQDDDTNSSSNESQQCEESTPLNTALEENIAMQFSPLRVSYDAIALFARILLVYRFNKRRVGLVVDRDPFGTMMISIKDYVIILHADRSMCVCGKNIP